MSLVKNFPYDALEAGQTATYSKHVEERDIQLFAAVSGDCNPVHLDADYATTMFKERIGPRHVQRRPDQRGDRLPTAWPRHHLSGSEPEVQPPGQTRRHPERAPGSAGKLPKGRVKLATRVFNQNDEQVVDGEAEVLAPRSEQTLEMPTRRLSPSADQPRAGQHAGVAQAPSPERAGKKNGRPKSPKIALRAL